MPADWSESESGPLEGVAAAAEEVADEQRQIARQARSMRAQASRKTSVEVA